MCLEQKVDYGSQIKKTSLCLCMWMCACVWTVLGGILHSSSISARYTEPLVIFSSSVNATVSVGGAYNFSCNASNYIQLQWIFHDQNTPFPGVVSNTTDGRRVITQDNELHLTNIRFEDEAMYECRLRNNLGMMSLWNKLTVVGKMSTVCRLLVY